jgi:hypothetical protein
MADTLMIGARPPDCKLYLRDQTHQNNASISASQLPAPIDVPVGFAAPARAARDPLHTEPVRGADPIPKKIRTGLRGFSPRRRVPL